MLQSLSNFEFIPGETPVSSLSTALATCAAYLIAVFAIKHVMKDRKPFDLKTVSSENTS
jgi:hypothetical protein